MLTEICQHLKNWFDIGRWYGKITISNNALATDIGLQPNQYFRVIGSVFNDGVHKYSASDKLTDEEFEGAIWLMAVPPAVVDLSGRITEWNNTYGDAVAKPFQSESFGGYSYTKAGSGTGSSSSAPTWQSTFADELNRWRKI
jgi:hypothetical protein